MKVLVVEDEKEILHGMREALEALPGLFTRIDLAQDAEAALELARRERPDLVITDIVMPGQSGLELIERLQAAQGRLPKTILVSGYNDFEYARQGIRLGVVDYILKPLDKKQLHQVIRGAVALIEEERREKDRREPYAEPGAKTPREHFIYGLCMNASSLQEDLYHRLKFWGIEWLAHCDYAVIALGVPHPAGAAASEKEAELQSFVVGNIAADLVRGRPRTLLFKNTMNQWCLILGDQDPALLAGEILAAMLQYRKAPVHIGISETMNSFRSLAAAYDQALQALKLGMLSSDSFIREYGALKGLFEAAERDRPTVAELLKLGDDRKLARLADRVLKELAISGDAKNVRALSQQALDWLIGLHTQLSRELDSSLHHVPLELWEALDRADTFEELKSRMLDDLRQLSKKISSPHTHFMIEKAKLLIREHYADNIGLPWIAEQLAISPAWFSQLFKRECGRNFVDYLTDIRIEEAKRLLRESTLKVYEIAGKVGYQDLQHFGHVFKKKTGQSPKEFRYGR